MKTDLNRAVIYQVYLRTMTGEGTIKAAERLIPHIADLGIDIIYLSVCNTEDTSVEGQSPRQLASGMNNVKNPYRVSDYFNIDDEYGTIDDLKDFIDTAHSYGLKVLVDLVYLHCGTSAVFIKDNPDFVVRDENGDIKIGDGWPFARLNYDNPKLREYMWSNMEFYIKDMNADGVRCDVGDMVPLDFWREGARRIREINPDVILLNEGEKEETLEVFDINYQFKVIYAINDAFIAAKDKSGMTAADLKNIIIEESAKIPEGKFMICNSENHDTVSDLGLKRPEIYLGSDAAETIMALLFTLKGVPFLYNGCEVADSIEKSMFWNRFSAGNHAVQWQNALTAAGRNRMKYLKELISLRRSDDALCYGNISWLENDCEETVLTFERRTSNDCTYVTVNISPQKQVVHADNISTEKILFNKNAEIVNDEFILEPYGVLITK